MDASGAPEPRKVEAPNAAGATRFSMRNLPLLQEGATFDALATAENLWLSVKVYSSGGENILHAHKNDDHSFVVMQGRATFEFGDGSTCEVRQYEGVMLPRGTMYRFTAGEEENLVILRVAGAQRKNPGQIGPVDKHGTPLDVRGETVNADGTKKDARDPKTGTPAKRIVAKPGAFFAKD